MIPTDKYLHCNHHHELTKDHAIIDLDEEKIVANKDAIRLLLALHEVGIKTRTHHYTKKDRRGFVGIILDNVSFEVRKVFESHSTRKKFNGKFELLIRWKNEIYK